MSGFADTHRVPPLRAHHHARGTGGYSDRARSAHSACTGPCEPSLGFCLRVMSWPQSEHVPTVAVTHAWHPRRSCQSIPQEVVRVITASQLRAAAAELLEEGLHRHPSVLWHVREVNLFDLRGVRLR